MPIDAKVAINEYGQVYHGENKCSLGFDPSGISEDGTGLIHGMFTIMDENEISLELFKTVKKLMKAECKISRGWHIGKEAKEAIRGPDIMSGPFLTIVIKNICLL